MDNSPGPSTDQDTSTLNGWRWDTAADDYVKDAGDIPDEIADIIDDAGGGHDPLSTEQFRQLVDDDRFRGAVAKLMNWGGRVYDLKSLQIDQSDPSFQEAMEVAYRRLLDGPGSHILKLMSNRDLVDFFIISAWAGPFGKSVADEIKAKKQAKLAQGKSESVNAPSTKNSNDGEDDNNGE